MTEKRLDLDRISKIEIKKTRHYCRYSFSQEEKQAMATDMATVISRLEDLEEERKAVASDFKSRIEAENFQVRTLAQKLRAGFEMRDMPCEEEWDFAAGTIRTIRIDTNETVKVRNMTDADRQAEMFPDAE